MYIYIDIPRYIHIYMYMYFTKKKDSGIGVLPEFCEIFKKRFL